MADTYWDHPSRREIKRLIDLGDAGAILDDLQNRETEWDDAREALDYLVRGPRAEAERLRAERDDHLAVAAETDVDWLAEHVRQAVHYVLGQIEPRLDNKVRAEASEQAAIHIKAGSVPIITDRVVGLAIEYVRRAEAERDRLAEQVQRAQDPDLIRRAIADPGAYVKRKLDHGEPAETVPAWGARAVIAALGGTEAGQ